MRAEGNGSFRAAARPNMASAALQDSKGRVFAVPVWSTAHGTQLFTFTSVWSLLTHSWKTGDCWGGTSQGIGDHSLGGGGAEPALWFIPSLKSPVSCDSSPDVTSNTEASWHYLGSRQRLLLLKQANKGSRLWLWGLHHLRVWSNIHISHVQADPCMHTPYTMGVCFI